MMSIERMNRATQRGWIAFAASHCVSRIGKVFVLVTAPVFVYANTNSGAGHPFRLRVFVEHTIDLFPFGRSFTVSLLLIMIFANSFRKISLSNLKHKKTRNPHDTIEFFTV